MGIQYMNSPQSFMKAAKAENDQNKIPLFVRKIILYNPNHMVLQIGKHLNER